jgi:large conductance mechanosensitive channel
LTFVLVALVLFFLVVKPVNALMDRRRTEAAVDEPTATCPHCLSEIPAAASRCAFCTQEVAAS